MSSLADLRREYASRALTEADAHEDPIQQFSLWFGEALKSELLDTNAMSLATATAAGEPSARIVLLKGFDEARLRVLHELRERQGPRSWRTTRARRC